MDIVIKKDGKELSPQSKEVVDYGAKLQSKILSFIDTKLHSYNEIEFQDDMERLRFANSILNESSPMAVLTVLLLLATTERDRVKLDAARVLGNWVGLEKTGNMGVVVNLSELSGDEIRGEIVDMKSEFNTDRDKPTET